MTQHDDSCPTCGSQLTALSRVELRRCNGCRRNNPAGFLYCGYCAAPMEHTEIRARVAEVAAPPGGWPNLAGDLTEVKFFLKQGQLDEAYDLLSILQRRYPGHPELADFARSTAAAPKPDADVESLVDSVLADSSSLGGKAPRRRAARWDAPESKPVERRGRKLTTAHEVVQAALREDADEEITNPRAKVVVAEYAKNPRPARKTPPKVEHTHAFEAVPPKRTIPRVRLKSPRGRMPTPKLLDKPIKPPPLRKPRTAEAEPKASVPQRLSPDRVPTRPEPVAPPIDDPSSLPPVPAPSYADKGRPATVHMPPVRADETPLPSELVSEPKPEPPMEFLQAEKLEDAPSKDAEQGDEAGPKHTVVVDALQPAAPYATEQSRTMAVDALQPAAPFEGESPETFEARKEQIKRATSKTGRRRRVPTGANKAKAQGKAKDKGGRNRKRPRGVPPKREDEAGESKTRGTAFGAGVLARFGR